MRTLIVALLLAGLAHADQLTPYGTKSFRSTNRQWVLETSEAKGKLVYALKDAKGRVRGKGTLDHLPIAVSVFDDGGGFALWGRYLREGRGIYAAQYTPTGQRLWGRTFREIFTEEERDDLPRTLSFVFAAERCWINPKKGEFVCAATNGTIKIFRMRDGQYRPGAHQAILDGITLDPPPPGAVRTAALRIPGKARTRLVEIASNEEQSLEVRVAAAVALPPARARELLQRAAVGKIAPDEAVAQLIKLEDTRALIYVVSHGEVPPLLKRRAAGFLAGRPAGEVLEPLLKEFEDADAETSVILLDTLIRIGGKSLPRTLQPYQTKLIDLIGRKDADIGWLAACFTQYPTTEAAKALLNAVPKHPRHRKQLFDALRACTGLKLGNDLAAWRRAVR